MPARGFRGERTRGTEQHGATRSAVRPSAAIPTRDRQVRPPRCPLGRLARRLRVRPEMTTATTATSTAKPFASGSPPRARVRIPGRQGGRRSRRSRSSGCRRVARRRRQPRRPTATGAHRAHPRQREAAAGGAPGSRAERIAFGANMTSLNFALSGWRRASWRPGTRSSSLDSTTMRTSRRGSSSRAIRTSSCGSPTSTRTDARRRRPARHSRGARESSLSGRVQRVGTRVDVARVCGLAHQVGALAWVDASQRRATSR